VLTAKKRKQGAVLESEAPSFFGRGQELGWLRRQLFPSLEPSDATPILLVHGYQEIGKSALVRAFAEQSLAEGSRQPAAAFWWEGPVRAATLSQFGDALLKTGWSTLSELQANRSILSRGLGSVSTPSQSMEPAKVAAYTKDGSAADIERNPLVTLAEEESFLARKFGKMLLDWLEPRGGRAKVAGLDALFRLVFIFDAFESYPTAVKNWLGRHLLPALHADPRFPRSCILLTGRQSWEEGEQADYWESHPGSFKQMLLGPLDRFACEEWLQAAGKPLSLVDILLEESEGVPGRIQRILTFDRYLEKKRDEPAQAEGLLSGYDARQRRWLHAAAMSRLVHRELLQVLLGRIDAEKAFQWLRDQETLCWRDSRAGEEVLALKESARDEIIRRVTSKVPARHREFLEKANVLTQVISKVDSFEKREYLRHLTPIQPFNRELIREVFGENG